MRPASVETILKTRADYSEIMELQIYLLAKSSIYHWETRRMLYLKTAKERYEWFLKQYPGYINCVPHSEIASFLNISRETLSRIRHL